MKQILFLLLIPISGWLSAQTAAETQVDSLITISRTYTGNHDYPHAVETALAADRLALENFGRVSKPYGSASFNHGRVLYFQGLYDEAEPWYVESRNVRAQVIGTNHPDYGKSLNNLAILYDVMGQYEKAEPLYLEVLSIREKTPGKESAAYADALSNLAGLYMQMGYFEKSEQLNLEVLEIREKVLGMDDPAYASSLNNLANLYYVLHNYQKAEELYLASIAIREKNGDRESQEYMSIIDNLGAMYQVGGQVEKAEPLLLQSKYLREKTFGKEHPSFALSLNHLANLYQKAKNYPKAESFFLEAQEAGEKALGKEHPDNALNKESLAVLYYETGRYDKAQSLLLECNALYVKLHGKDHPYYSSNLDFLASAYWASGNLHVAQGYLEEAARTKRKLLINASRHLSERELEAYIRDFVDGLGRACSFAAHAPDMAATCYDDILFYKGFLLNAVSQVRRLVSTDPAVTEKFNLYKSYCRRLAAEYAKPVSERNGLGALEAQADRLEKELTRTVAGYSDATRHPGWKDVQAALPPDAVAIEFVHYALVQPFSTDSVMYAALVLLPDAAEPVLLPLFEEKQLAALVQTSGKRQADYVDRLYGATDRGSNGGADLYELIWQPIEKILQKVNSGDETIKTIYFSPSGLLHCINLAAVAVPDGQVLSERYQLVQVGSTRQLALHKKDAKEEQSPNAATQASAALLFGGIQYEPDASLPSETLQKPALTDNISGLRGGSWNYLKGTEKEVEQISAMMKTSGWNPAVLKGNAATEESFKTIGQAESVSTPHSSPQVLHFATHGFFYPNPQGKLMTGKATEASAFQFSDLPMMRSGLVMAGGNYAWKEGKPFRPGLEDGILTAYEIAQTDLSYTQLVVLSACETGLGDIHGDEGVYGLQRAFKIAGARYLIMSLWRVPDAATQELMTAYYQKWLIQKMTIPDAFREAQKEIRDKYQHPFFWAGFVLVE